VLKYIISFLRQRQRPKQRSKPATNNQEPAANRVRDSSDILFDN